MQFFASFSWYFYLYSLWTAEMDLGKIWETTNQLSLALFLIGEFVGTVDRMLSLYWSKDNLILHIVIEP